MIGVFRALRRTFGKLVSSRTAIGAVEFAMVAPFLILLYVGGYQLMDAISAYRKVTITARALADLASQNEQLTPDDAVSMMTGARQVMTPYSTASSTLVFAEIGIDKNGTPTITWVCSNQSTPKCASSNPDIQISDIDLPNELLVPNTNIIFSNMLFNYMPVIGGSLVGPLHFSDHIFMNPRRSPAVCLNTGTQAVPICIGEGTS